jgi:hypothetical protein
MGISSLTAQLLLLYTTGLYKRVAQPLPRTFLLLLLNLFFLQTIPPSDENRPYITHFRRGSHRAKKKASRQKKESIGTMRTRVTSNAHRHFRVLPPYL